MCKPTNTATAAASSAPVASSPSSSSSPSDPKQPDVDVNVVVPSNEKGFKTFNGNTPGKFRKSKGLWVAAGLATLACSFSIWQIYDAIVAGVFDYTKGLLVFVVAYFLVDIFSGLLHIVLDNPYFATTPNILQMPAIGFQEHHLNVNLIGKLSLQQHLSPMGIPIFLNTILGQICAQFRSDKDIGCIYSVCALSTAFFLVLMQMAHRWSHVSIDKRPLGVTTLQKWGLLVSAAEHSKHHRPPYESYFCIMSGIMNPILNIVVSKVLGPHSKSWTYVFGAFVLAPHIIMMMI